MDILFVTLLYWVSLDMKHKHDPQVYIGFIIYSTSQTSPLEINRREIKIFFKKRWIRWLLLGQPRSYVCGSERQKRKTQQSQSDGVCWFSYIWLSWNILRTEHWHIDKLQYTQSKEFLKSQKVFYFLLKTGCWWFVPGFTAHTPIFFFFFLFFKAKLKQ